ncbi:trehalose-phosphatase [Noviherbaspirillum sp. CPCC 100848]|uniref:Trehalose 6-phosphate phosphatase n=1 Tax=Noviherbaspirillum album TaxID=3080276 RepID=A0ABU6JHP0_9BURK|nr:trehalose-phosphatase [Noviherbaspirillum sp. CPCC 100848]MEC4723166.1 trehalose-phosphatase [Noviherbaspirillum sp. CPCC 100848]
MAVSFLEHGTGRLLDIVRPGMLCAFDFDGTIAPIVDDPAAARVAPSVLRRLAVLAEFTPVAIITGRSLEDISLRLDFFPEFVIGNHGMEGLPGEEWNEERYRLSCRAWLHDLQGALGRAGLDPAIWIEDKIYSLSVHYRLAQDPQAMESKLRRLLEDTLPGVKIVDGKFVFNLLPADAPDKGQALEMLRDLVRAPSALYVGDDVTDESVFHLPHDDLLTLRIENRPDTAAEFFLPDLAGMPQFLDMLLERLSGILHAEAASSMRRHR